MPVNNKIKIRRGNNIDLPSGGTESGELRYSIDTKELYIDDGSLNIKIGGDPYGFPISTATQTALNLKVDKVTGSSLVADSEILANRTAVKKVTTLTTDGGQLTGFVDPIAVNVSYNGITRKITLTGDIRAAYKGIPMTEIIPSFVSGWQSEAHDITNGGYFLYFNGTNFVWSTISWDFKQLQIAYVYRDGVNFCLRECHGLMDWQSHESNHNNIGTYLKSGADVSGFILNSDVATNRRPTVSQALVYDEDLPSILPELTNGLYSRLFLDGANNANLENDKTDIIEYTAGNRFTYNLFTGGVWTKATAANNQYAKVFLMAVPVTSDADCQKNRFIWIMPQTVNSTLTTIQNLTPANLSLGQISTALAEYVFVQEFIIRATANGWTIVSTAKLTGNKRFQSVTSGNFLSSVAHDTSITGDGTSGNPLGTTHAILPNKNEEADFQHLTAAQVTKVNNTSGTNTGDETLTSIKTKLGAATSVSDGYLKYQDWNTFNSKEPAITKNTAFNKNFGTTPGTVLEGRTFGTAANSAVGDFIQNNPPSAQSGSFSISGDAQLGGKINVGVSTSTNSVDPAVNVNRNLTSGTGNAHGFSDSSIFGRNGGAYAAFDGRYSLSGVGNFDHTVPFQAAATYSSTGTLSDAFGLFTTIIQTDGTILRNYGAYIANPVRSSGVMTNNYGIYVANQTAGTNNYAAVFNGKVGIDNSQPINDLSVGATTSLSGRIGVKQTTTTNGIYSQSPTTDALIRIYHDETKSVLESTYTESAGYTPLSFHTSGSSRYEIGINGNHDFKNGNISTSGNLGVGGVSSEAKIEALGVSGKIFKAGTLTNDGGWNHAFGVENGNGLFVSKINAPNNTPSNYVASISRNDTYGGAVSVYGISGSVGASMKGDGTVTASSFIGSGSNLTGVQLPITLTTNGTSGAATFSGNVLNVPNYNASSDVYQERTTVNGSTSGYMICSMPFRTGVYKKVLIRTNGLNGSATYTFPTSFLVESGIGPYYSIHTAGGSVTVSSCTRTSITLSSAVDFSAYIVVEGY